MFDSKDLILHISNLRRFALRLSRNKSDADDLVQATIVRALEKKHLFKEGTNLHGWLSKIMFNIFLNEYKKNKVKARSTVSFTDEVNTVPCAPEQDFGLEFIKAQEAMENLNQNYRSILELICIEGRSYQEASEMLNIPIGTVRSRVSRAKQSMRDLVEKKRQKYYASLSPARVSGGAIGKF